MKIETLEPETNKSEVNPRVVSKAEWLVARKDLLTREKELTRLRDEVSRHRRGMPWVRDARGYIFQRPEGQNTQADVCVDRQRASAVSLMFGSAVERRS